MQAPAPEVSLGCGWPSVPWGTKKLVGIFGRIGLSADLHERCRPGKHALFVSELVVYAVAFAIVLECSVALDCSNSHELDGLDHQVGFAIGFSVVTAFVVGSLHKLDDC